MKSKEYMGEDIRRKNGSNRLQIQLEADGEHPEMEKNGLWRVLCREC